MHLRYILGAGILGFSSLSVAKTVNLEVTLTWGSVAPDGHRRQGILMNGKPFPGPLLELSVGDDVEFLVHNNLPFEETIHFHGITQLHTPWSDGTPGVSQRPIKPGGSFLYKWTADEYGTYWYHSHDRGHLMDGLIGPILIHPSPDEPSPFDKISSNPADVTKMKAAELAPQLVTLSDWSHFTADQYFQIEVDANIDNFCMDSILINGKGSEICLPQSQINSLTTPAMKSVLKGKQLTAKGCLPVGATDAQGNDTHNLARVPPDAFDRCQPSKGQMEIISVDPASGWASVNLINAAGINRLTFSIDQHKMWIYSADGRHIEPVQVDAITVANGNRYQAMVKLDQKPGDYTIRVANPGINQLFSGFATFSYKAARRPTFGSPFNKSTPSITYAAQAARAGVVFFDETKQAVPFPPTKPNPTANKSFNLKIDRFGKPWKWTLNGRASYGLELADQPPLLFNPKSGLAVNENLTISTNNGDWVDLIVEVAFPPLQPPHPLHKHSNKAYIIGQGTGAFPGNTVADAMQAAPGSFNLQNPPYRDGFTTIATTSEPTWMVIRYNVVNPGAFFFHCHIQTHFDGGMAIVILDGIDQWPTVPPEYLNGNGGA